MHFLPSTSATDIFTKETPKKALPGSRGNEFMGIISSIMNTDTEVMNKTSAHNIKQNITMKNSNVSITGKNNDAIKMSNMSSTDKNNDAIKTSNMSSTSKKSNTIKTSNTSATDKNNDAIKTSSMSNTGKKSNAIKTSSTSATDKNNDAIKTSNMSNTGKKSNAIKTSNTSKISNEKNEITSPSGTRLYSFIEEDRTEYTGAPVTFSTYAKDRGTISKDQVLTLRKKLKEKGAQDESIDCLNQLLASGAPLTLGTIFSSLEGTSRSSAELSDDERKTFRTIMGKLGASSEEVDSLLEDSDKGDKKAVWGKIVSKLQEQQGEIQVSKKEMKSLLKSLDLSKETTSTIMDNFNGEETLSLDSKKLSDLLIPAEAELTNRAAAEAKVKDIMHEAMSKTFEEDKKNKITAPVEDNRGNKRTNQSEELIQDTSKKKSGFDNFIASINGEDKDFEEKEEAFHKDPSEQKHTSTFDENSGTVNANIKASEANKEKDSASQMLSLIETQPLENMQIEGEIKDLNALAGKHRQEIFTQVESGLLQGKANGSNELSLELAPAELGRVNLILNMKEGEIRATIRTERQESATVIAEQMAELKANLEEQGLKVAEIEVQVGLKEETSQSNQWNNQNDHNMRRDTQERDRSRQVAHLRREAGSSSNKSLDIEQKISSQMGLHIVA